MNETKSEDPAAAKPPDQYDYSYAFMVNKHDGSWRYRVGDWLRRMASRFDNRISLALHIATYPELQPSDVVEAVRAGMKLTQDNIAKLCEMEAQEAAAARVHQSLWQER